MNRSQKEFTKQNRQELYWNGWTVCEFDGRDDSLLDIAHNLGVPVPHKLSAPLIQSLTPRSHGSGTGKSLSKLFGMGSFPLHTDTAHWPVPARFVILADVGVLHDRPTLLLGRAEFLAHFDPADVGHSVWKAPGPSGSFLCSLSFHTIEGFGTRFDPVCMQPQNAAAQSVIDRFAAICPEPIQITWKQNRLLVIDNWHVLHGRASSAMLDSGKRVLKRVLINSLERN
jgi:hypothetical protein